MSLIIGLCGPEGAGKSTVAKLLARKRNASIIPFAAPLKAMAAALGIPGRNIYGTDKDKAKPLALLGGKSARWALQTLGTQWGRMCMDADLWVRAWASRVDSEPSADCIVADDVRFNNETAEIHRRGGFMICVVRSMDDFDRVPQHQSEDFAALKIDGIIINNGSFEKLDHALGELLSLMQHRHDPVYETACTLPAE